jgi:hypothetical protein
MRRDRDRPVVRRLTRRLGPALLATLAVAACGADDAPAPDARPDAASDRPRERPEPRSTRRERPARRAPRARCPAAAPRCASVRGRVIFVEAVDPDGDGDAHLVLAGGNVTAPGISAVAIRRELRPRRLPRVGDEVSAAGMVYRGSYGQSQIEADVLHVARR